MNETADTKPTRDQRNRPGMRSLLLKVDEEAYRQFRSRAMRLGLENPEYLVKLLALEAEHPIE